MQGIRIDAETESRAVELYRQELSPRRVGEELGISGRSVHNILIRYNESRRSISEACMKYPKIDFGGDLAEQARICGFLEDCNPRLRHKQIEVQTSTTHSAQISLFNEIFGKNGHVGRTPGYNKQLSLYYWHLYVSLKRPSFEFLVEYKENPMKFLSVIAENGYEYFYISSLTDAEGCVGIYDDNGYIRLVLVITDKNRQILEWTRRKLGGDIVPTNDGYNLQIRDEEAIEALQRLPMMHEEKVAAKELILRLYSNSSIGLEALWEYRELRRRIDDEVRSCTMQARLEWMHKRGKPHKYDLDHTILQKLGATPSL